MAAYYSQQGPPKAGYGEPQVNYGYQPPGPIQTQPHHTNTNTTVVIQQPGRGTGLPRAWSTGLCDICGDCSICLCGCFFPICYAMSLASDMDEFVCLPCCVPGATINMRTKLRTQENIQGSICNDCLIDTFCPNCALCQLGRELKAVRQAHR